MYKVFWLSLLSLFILWFVFSKFWVSNDNDNFNFSDRDKKMVFPTTKMTTADPFTELKVTPTVATDTPTFIIKNSSDTSTIKF